MQQATAQGFSHAITRRWSGAPTTPSGVVFLALVSVVLGGLLAIAHAQLPWPFLVGPAYAERAHQLMALAYRAALLCGLLLGAAAPLAVYAARGSSKALILYELQPDWAWRFHQVVEALVQLGQAGVGWVPGGLAESLGGKQVRATVGRGHPTLLITNARGVRIAAGTTTFYVLPDGIWVEEEHRLRLYPWHDLRIRRLRADPEALALQGDGLDLVLKAKGPEMAGAVEEAVSDLVG